MSLFFSSHYNYLQFFSADIGDHVLGICQRNLNRNCPRHQSNIAVRELDWRHPVPVSTEGDFLWTPEDQTALQHTSLILAADGEAHSPRQASCVFKLSLLL